MVVNGSPKGDFSRKLRVASDLMGWRAKFRQLVWAKYRRAVL